MAFNYHANASRVGKRVTTKEGVFDTKASLAFGDALYPFTAFTFTNAGQTGRTGPSLSTCLASYDTVTNPWLLDTNIFNVPNDAGIQYWTVPRSGTYRIKVYGAQGGNNTADSNGPGQGAIIQGDFVLTKGEVLKILVGQEGASTTDSCGGAGGGGGTFVTDISNNPLIIAGGGSGNGYGNDVWSAGQDGRSGNDGGDQYPQTPNLASYQALGGTNGNGGGIQPTIGCSNNEASSGGGLLTNGVVAVGNTSVQSGGQAFVNGGIGGESTSYREGGFGGGGGARYGSGGGGGYSGGAAGGLQDLCSCSFMIVGGGGGSYNTGSNPINQQGGNAGHGKVEITLI